MPIQHNYYQKGTNMGGLSVNARKRPQTFGQIDDLDCYSDPLKKVCKNIGLACGWLQSPTKIAEKAHGIWAHRTAGFHCNWLKLISLVQVSILLCLLSFCMRCCPTHFFGRCSSIGVTKGEALPWIELQLSRGRDVLTPIYSLLCDCSHTRSNGPTYWSITP